MWVRSLGWEDPLEQEMATHSSILGWKISQTEESGGLHSMDGKDLDATEQLRTHAPKAVLTLHGQYPIKTSTVM